MEICDKCDNVNKGEIYETKEGGYVCIECYLGNNDYLNDISKEGAQ